MKRLTALLLATLMLFASLGVMASAADIEEVSVTGECDCRDCKYYGYSDAMLEGRPNDCHCCVLCSKLDKTYLTACAKNSSTDGSFDGSVCCGSCTGIWDAQGCGCSCDCCVVENEDIKDNDSILDDVWDEDDRDAFVDGFQAIIKRIADWFDMVFNAIFEFLRLDEVLGRN